MNADEERRTGHSPKRKLHRCWNHAGQHNLERRRIQMARRLNRPGVISLTPRFSAPAPTLRDTFNKRKRGPGLFGKVGGAIGRLFGRRKTG